MARRGMRRYIDRRSGTFKIQITSMVDMFVIMLVFLLKSFSTSPVQINPNKDLRLPASVSPKQLEKETLTLVVSKKGVFVDDQKVMDLDNGELTKKDMDPQDPKFVKPLYEALTKEREKTGQIAKLNETVEFEGRVLMQADRDLNYNTLQKIMYTSSMAGYADLKLAVVSPN